MFSFKIKFIKVLTIANPSMKNKNYMILFVLLAFLTYPLLTFSFQIDEIENGVFVHFGVHEDSNHLNEGDIANIGFIVGEKSIMVIDTGGTLQSESF